MNKPLFSVLIANYNNGNYIQECIESVFAQDYKEWEIIIVDDASTDNSKSIYLLYANHPQIHIYFNDKNRGVTYTKWRCIEEAKGDFCGFLDPDDTILPNALSLMVSNHLQDLDISIISSRYYVCDEDMNVQSESGYLRIPKDNSYLTYMQYAPWPFISFKMSKYEQTKGLNRYNNIGDDQELCLLLEEVGKWHVLDDITYKYRIKKDSLSQSDKRRCLYWNLIVYHEACMRRGLNPDIYAFKNFISIIDDAQNEWRLSREYKLGRILLYPFRILQKFMRVIF